MVHVESHLTRKQVHELASQILDSLNIPRDAIAVIVGNSEYQRYMQSTYGVHNASRTGLWGQTLPADKGFGIYEINMRDSNLVKETIIHEVGHILFPEKSELWVAGFSYLMSKEGQEKQMALKMARRRAKKKYSK